MKVLAVFVAFFLFSVSSFSQERIEEKVNVKWWVVPLFAVDREGNPVDDLKGEDLQFEVNKQTNTEFTLIKRDFNVNGASAQNQVMPALAKKKMVFFLFDIAFSNLENFKKSVEIARNIVENSDTSTVFSIYTIDPFAGLVYAGGPLQQKTEVMAMIEKKVVLNPQARSIETADQIGDYAQADGKKASKFNASELAFLTAAREGASLANMDRDYFRSLDALAYTMNSFQDNKFVYFFSEGLSWFTRRFLGTAEFQQFISQTAASFSRSGAVLFIINPAGVSVSSQTERSGEDSLRGLADESGGKYFDGEKQNIAHRIQNMHRAYYEIAFPGQDDGPGSVLKISVSTRRPGVTIHTIHSLEESRPYAKLNEIEKEFFALNLINRNPFFLKRMALPDLMVKKHYRQKDKEVYVIAIPDNWLHQELDLYQARINRTSGTAEIEKSLWSAETAEKTIELDSQENIMAGFVVINAKLQAALLLKPETEKTEAPVIEKKPEIKAMADEFQYNAEMTTILAGVAGYCEKLKQAGFHYFCTEKIVETLNGFEENPEDDIGYNANPVSLTGNPDMLGRSHRSSRTKKALVSKFTFDYQLIKKQNEVQEQRKLISKKNERENEKNSVAAMMAFLSEKAVFAPITLFARERQPLYEYRFIAYEKVKGVRCAVIEALPRNQEDARYVYGQAWIDPQDYSVLKVKANPRSIAGYEKLQVIAKQLAAKLTLNLEISFNQMHAGMRFPDLVILSELYKGGSYVESDRLTTNFQRMGPGGWERIHIEYSYRDYRFFEVGVQSTEKPQ